MKRQFLVRREGKYQDMVGLQEVENVFTRKVKLESFRRAISRALEADSVPSGVSAPPLKSLPTAPPETVSEPSPRIFYERFNYALP